MLYKKVNLDEKKIRVEYVGISNEHIAVGFIEAPEKIAQCRYCPNSSHEGPGVFFKDGERWICIICLEELEEQKKLAMKKL